MKFLTFLLLVIVGSTIIALVGKEAQSLKASSKGLKAAVESHNPNRAAKLWDSFK